VPKISILVRKAYGGTTVFFFGLPKTVDFCYAWPTAEYAPMGPDGAVAIIYDRQIKALPDSESRLKFAEEKKKEYFDEYTDPFNEVKNMRYDFFDDIIDPRDTRKVIINALKLSRNKDRTRIMPKKRRTNRPI
jgi:acetyl-CoA carboxylase carboxyltransferase component